MSDSTATPNEPNPHTTEQNPNQATPSEPTLNEPVPMLDLKAQVDAHFDEFHEAIGRVLRSTRFILGPEVSAFENEAAEYLGVRATVGLASGTDALVIGLRTLGIGPGDEVITSPFTFFATGEAIRAVGATPVFADIEPDTYCIRPDQIESLVTQRTRAIVPVHLYGQAADMDAIGAIAERHQLVILEDAAQAFGAALSGRKLGSFGAAAAFSFFPSKNLGAFGDGGLLATDSEEIAAQARLLRNHGQVDRYHHSAFGYTARLDEIQAAILRIKLRHLDRWNDQRRAVAATYSQRLSQISGIVPPAERPGARHVYHQYTLRVLNEQRDRLQRSLTDSGVTSVVHYPVPLHGFPVFEQNPTHLSEAERAAREVLCLPIWPELSTATCHKICDAIEQSLGHSN